MKTFLAFLTSAILAFVAFKVLGNDAHLRSGPLDTGSRLMASAAAGVYGFIAYIFLAWITPYGMSARDRFNTSPFAHLWRVFIIPIGATVISGMFLLHFAFFAGKG